MTVKDEGRVDWMPRKKVWRAIGYEGRRDIVIGEHTLKESAQQMLRDWIARKSTRRR